MDKITFPLAGQTCVITGATSGIGLAAAKALSAAGANLLLVGRRESLGIQIAAKLRQKPGAGWVEFLRADLSDFAQVRQLASGISAKHRSVDILINNAGARFNKFQKASSGVELTFATNHLGHFLLTSLLLEPLLRAPSARVITVGSGAHGGVDASGSWWLEEEHYDRKLAYGKSKLANIVFSYELARRLRSTKVTSNAVDPGGVATNLGRNNGLLSWFRHLAYYGLKRELLSPRVGAETVVYLATDPALRGVSGRYYCKKREVQSSAASRDANAAAQLWSLSVELTNLNAQIGPAWNWVDPAAHASSFAVQ